MRGLSGLLVCVTPLAWAADPGTQRPRDLTEISIEELAAVEITSVAKKAQRLSRTAAAVYVIPREEIRRSGATSIPELLRMVPGLQVARLGAHQWIVTARGFAGIYSNKLLVLIDGRSVYTTQFSGVNWDERDTLLEDIERIEVIRGPGATMWGANAVNGVINIITRPARDTQGLLLAAGTGSLESESTAARYGFRAGPNLHARVFGKYFARREFRYSSGRSAQDEWRMSRGGFRLDWEPNRRDALTLEGDIYRGHANDLVGIAELAPFSRTILTQARLAGGSLLARWQRRFTEGSELELVGYYDESHRSEAPLSWKATHIAGFDLQYRFRRARHELSWGLGHRVTFDRFDGSFTVTMTPPRRTDQLFNTFVQDEIGLVEDRLALTVGSKLEHNSYTGFEVEPSARLLWTPGARHGFWGAVSRAARTPSHADCCIRMNIAAFPGPQGLSVLSVGGTRGFQSEYLWAYEAGYRVQPARWLSVDTAGFYNVYDGLRSQEPGVPFFESAPAPAHLVIPIRFQNGIAGSAHGLEIASKWQPVARWRLNADFSWLRLAMRQSGALPQAEAERLENTSPQYQAHLHSYLNLPGGLEFDAGLYYVDPLPEHDIPRYLRADARVGWRWRGLEVSAGVENLADRSHPEFWERTDNTPETVGVGRSMYLKLSWRFD